MSTPENRDPPPARAPWPPILMAAVVIAGRAMDALSAGAFEALLSSSFVAVIGVVIVALALANDMWCAMTLARHRTTIMPHRAASHLATDGPFSRSRNPIYVSHVAVIFGLGLLMKSPFTILLTPLLAVGLTKLSIEPEERHLQRKFGDDYCAYMARTRRWL